MSNKHQPNIDGTATFSEVDRSINASLSKRGLLAKRVKDQSKRIQQIKTIQAKIGSSKKLWALGLEEL